MKKRTKKKIKKGTVNFIKSFFQIIWEIIVMLGQGLVYLYKGLAYLVEKLFELLGWIFSSISNSDKENSSNNKLKTDIKNNKEVSSEKDKSKNKLKNKVEVKEEENKSSFSQKFSNLFSKEKKKLSKHEPIFQEFKIVRNKKGNLEKFEKFLYSNKSTIGIILGARGTGKSAIGMSLLENFAVKTGKNIYAMGFKQSSLPNWISVVKSIDQINNNSVLLVDEGGIEFSSRDAMSNSNKLLSDILLIARHKDLSVIFITQNSSNLEINAIRQADYLILKPSSLLQKDFERKKIKNVYSDVDTDFEELKEDRGLTYFYSDKYCGFISNGLPSFWSEKVSKGYSGN